MAFIDTLDCYTAAVNAPITSSENEFATSVNYDTGGEFSWVVHAAP